MNVQLLIDEIVRQTTVLIAQLSTSAGLRAPLSHVASQVFLELARELDAQGVRRRVVADMFGLALRSYQTKVRRLTEAHERSGGSLWQDVYTTLTQGSATRAELERRHRPYVPKQIAAALQDMVESGLAYSSGRGAETLFGLTTDADRQHLSATEALRVQRDLCRYLVASGSASTREHLQQQLRLSVEAVDVLVSALIAEGYLAQQGNELRARHFELGVGTEQGWETAVLDHFRAVTTAIAAKVNRPVAQADDEVGGSTRSFLVHAEHPYRQEVMNILRETRQRTAEIWTRVSAHNEAFPPPEDADRVTFYFGQNVVRGAADDLTTGANESANSEEVSQ